MDTKKITDMEVKLERNYPEDSWGSKATLFGRGLREGDITKEEYNEARDYYGHMWNYAGD